MSGSTPPASGVDPESVVTKDGVTATLGDWIVLDKVVPTALTNVVSTADSLTGINVTYDSIASNKVKTVKVDYSTDNTNWTNFTSLGGSSNTQVTGLTTDTDYYFRVYPSNIIGEGLVTNISSTTKTWVLPTIPTGVTLINVAEQPVLSWSASTGNPTPTYTVERSTSASSGFSAVSTSQAGLTFTDTTASLGVTYYYKIKSLNASGSSGYTSNSSIIIYPNPVVSYGNAIKNNGGKLVGYNTYTFLTAGTSSFVVDASATIKVLVVGGGGKGGSTQQRGGAGGGIVYTDEYTLSAGTYSVVVGGGNGGSVNSRRSTFDTNDAIGGGDNGGSSGTATLKSGITGNTYGGYSSGGNSTYSGGGGAGATQNGFNAGGYPSGSGGGVGGDGLSITGMEYVDKAFGGGGGGGAGWNAGGTAGNGGLGGGGQGAQDNSGCGSAGGVGQGAGGGSNCTPQGGTGTVMIRVSEA
jgi:hypothetical protein